MTLIEQAVDVLRESQEASQTARSVMKQAEQELIRRQAVIAELVSCLKAIVHEYDNTYDVDEPGDGTWRAAASIPVEVMQHAERLVHKHG